MQGGKGQCCTDSFLSTAEAGVKYGCSTVSSLSDSRCGHRQNWLSGFKEDSTEADEHND